MTIAGMILLIAVAIKYKCSMDTIMLVTAITWLAVVVDMKGGKG